MAAFSGSEGLFDSCGKILLAVSGGADSTALLYCMATLQSAGVVGADLLCGHVNHGLRGEQADLDEELVVEQSGGLGFGMVVRRVDVRGHARIERLSLETAARALRIESLLEIAEVCGCGCVATAHQKDDNAETVVQRLSRGTGFRGLGGIWPRRVFGGGIFFIRPLLCVGREEVVEYLGQRGILWRQDRTNLDCAYRRNYIRHRLLPALQEACAGALSGQLLELSRSARGFHGLVCGRAEEVWAEAAFAGGDSVALCTSVLAREVEPVQVELFRRVIVAAGCGEGDLTRRHYERILRLCKEGAWVKVELPGGVVVRRECDRLVFSKPVEKVPLSAGCCESARLAVPGRTEFGRYCVEAAVLESGQVEVGRLLGAKAGDVERFDLDELRLPLSVRFRRPGDRFLPLGLGAAKKVGKFLSAARVGREVRERIVIVADEEKIIWVWPVRMSELAKVSGRTRRILELRIECES